MERDEYLKRYSLLVGLQQKVSNSFEYVLFFVTSSAIVLPINFLGKLSSGCLSVSLLFGSVLIWVISLFLQLLSRFYNAEALREEIVILGEGYHSKKEPWRENQYEGTVTRLNIFAFSTFFIGVVLFVSFFLIILVSGSNVHV